MSDTLTIEDNKMSNEIIVYDKIKHSVSFKDKKKLFFLKCARLSADKAIDKRKKYKK